MSPLTISVIIPTYNRADLLPLAIESLLKQTRPAHEIIVVDDGSTDDTEWVLSGYGTALHVIHQPNSGLAAARNTGLQATTGDLIAFLDSDDLYAPENLERRTQVFEADNQAGVVYSNVRVIDAAGREQALYTDVRPGPRPSGMIFAQLARYNLMPPIAHMVRASCLKAVGGLFALDVPGVEDYDLWLRLAARFSFVYVDEPLAYYRVHGNMMNLTQSQMMRESDLEVHRRVFEMPAFRALPATEQAAIYCVHGSRYAMMGRMGEARRWYWKGLRTNPTAPRPYAMLAFSLLGARGFAALANWRRQGRQKTFSI